MGYCDKCGGYKDGEGCGHCYTCSAAIDTSSHAGLDTACQRCGMYLPSHELQMWNSRLFCPYCIMDLQDEERRISGEGRHMGGHNGAEALEVPCQNCWMRFSQAELRMRNGRLYCMHCLSCMEDEAKSLGGIACEKCGEHFVAYEIQREGAGKHCPMCVVIMDEQAKTREAGRIKRAKSASLKCDSCKAFLPHHKMQEINSKLYCPHCVDLHIEKYGACEKCLKGFDTVYVAFGKHLCMDCYMQEKGKEGAEGAKEPSFVEALVFQITHALG